MKNLEYCDLLDIYGKMLTDKQNNIMNQYYNLDCSLSEISENEKISRQAVMDTVRVAENSLTELEKKLGCFKKQKELSEQIDKLKEFLDDRTTEIADKIDKIIRS